MSETEPPDSRGAPQAEPPFPRLRHLLRRIRHRREDEAPDLAARENGTGGEGVHQPTPEERLLIDNIRKLHERAAGDVMVPRVDIFALDLETPLAEAVRSIVEHRHSRVPIYRETLDGVIGFVHVKDVLALTAEGGTGKLSGILREVLFVAPSLPILDLLVQMRQARTHIAMVVDEFGGIDGVVTIEDLIEEIVGEIEDEHDRAGGPHLIERGDGSLIADARTPIEELEKRRGTRLRLFEGDGEVDTLGGLVSILAGRVPRRGEVIAHPTGIEFEVLDADPRRVKRLRVRSAEKAAREDPHRDA
jgi:hemolysin (HlyC) family protein